MTSSGESVERGTADWGRFLWNHKLNIRKNILRKLTNYSKEEPVKNILDVELIKEW
jgi:hypothetical protein